MTRGLPTILLSVGLTALLHAQIDPRTALIERGAWNALTAGQAHAAAEAFREALAADPKNARLHLGAGIAATLERRDADARDAFERALALDAKLTQARALLGQVQHRMGDRLGALRTYEALLALSPDDREAQTTLDRWRRESELHDRMQQAVGSHFTVSFEGPAEAAIAVEALEVLDRAYWRVGQLLGTYPTDPVPVVLYTAEQFHDITRSPVWAAGAYDGTIRVPMRGALDNPQELDRVLSHEFTHALIRSLAARGVAERGARDRARSRRPGMGRETGEGDRRHGGAASTADGVRQVHRRPGAAGVRDQRARRAEAPRRGRRLRHREPAPRSR